MECADSKALMSEYLDDALDAQRKEALEQHLSTCGACEEELASLRTVVRELGSLEKVAAPDDFLDKLHERLERRSLPARVGRKLFSPFHIKLPLELAGAAVVAALVFAVVNVQLYRKEIIPERDLALTERVAESPRERPTEQVSKREFKRAAREVPAAPAGAVPGRDMGVAGKQVAKAPALTDRAAPKASLKQKQREPVHPADGFIELAVLIGKRHKRAQYDSEPAADEVAELEAPRAAAELSSAPVSEGLSTLKAGTTREGAAPEVLLARIKGLIENAGGDVMAVFYNEQTGQLKHITAQIPSTTYRTFAATVNSLSAFQQRLPEPMDEDAETVRVLIRFVYPE